MKAEERKSLLIKLLLVYVAIKLLSFGVDVYNNFDDYQAAYQAGYDAYEQYSPFE
ncbi:MULTISPECIES: hypothetical protein [Aerococcus]|uniref:hypothetical protein n=1 Tax=Aerococcus TaxID=1375 RepID=UPI001438EE8E|nr:MULTISPECIES: hypothetical protein [Aerococcus]MDK6369257.1 hypothetical protein [Aerococcus sp. UMB9870]MDK6679081.1 hypothetical protein [Aerococcus sp. UMB8608]MDK6686988.1 hypothetical protein [Aerococcus sp. UMB8623]MDK6940144.1 hypothetical protein [Aerococcus sp. UMB8487]